MANYLVFLDKNDYEGYEVSIDGNVVIDLVLPA